MPPNEISHPSLSPKLRDRKTWSRTILQQDPIREVIARNRKRQDLHRQQTLTQLHNWQKAARAVHQSKDYLNQIKAITDNFTGGQPLSSETVVAMRQDLSAHEQGINAMQRWQQAAKELGHSEEQCQRIEKMTEIFKQGYPLPELAAMAMHKALSHYEQQRSQLLVQEKLEQIRQNSELENKYFIGRERDDEYEW